MAVTDILTLAEAKAALNIAAASTTHDTELATFVSAVSQAIDALVGPVVRRTVTENYDGGKGMVFLRKPPVSSITSVSEYTGTTAQALAAETNLAKTANDFMLDGDAGILWRRSSGSANNFPTGRQNVAVVYVAGRYADTASVDAKFKRAAGMMLTHLWRNEQGASGTGFGGDQERPTYTPGFAVPNAVLQMLHGELLGPVIA